MTPGKPSRLAVQPITAPVAPIVGHQPKAFHASPKPLGPHITSPTLTRVLPEFNLQGKVIVVSGGARGLGLTQAEALLEAGAIGTNRHLFSPHGVSKPATSPHHKGMKLTCIQPVHAIDRLPTPDPDFEKVALRANAELATSLTYHQVDVRDVPALNEIVEGIANRHGRLDGLIAAAGIQQETPALEYKAEDVDKMMGVNVTGAFMTAQAVARQMVRLNTSGSIVLIASMSGTVANRGLICP